MKNIVRIFKRDVKKIFTNSLAIILAVGVAVLPSLYAWINIYANWDPYGSTGNMQVAVIIEDEGYTYRDIEINVGKEIESSLKGNKAIDWQFVDKEQGIKGTEAGEYYAAIEIPAGFSKSLTSIMSSDFKQPKLTYYSNEKKNAIATKITDKVVQTVQTEVNESFVTTVVNLINALLGTVVEEASVQGNTTVGTLNAQIKSAKKSVKSLEATLAGFEDIMEVTGELNKALADNNIKDLLNNADKTITSTKDVIEVTRASVSSITSSLDKVLTTTSNDLASAADTIEKANNLASTTLSGEIKSALATANSASTNLGLVISTLEKVNGSLPLPIDKVDDVIKELKADKAQVDSVIAVMNNMVENKTVTTSVSSLVSTLRSVSSSLSSVTNDYNTNLKPALNNNINSLLNVLVDLGNVLNAVNSDIPMLKTMASSLNGSMKAGSDMITSVKDLLDSCYTTLDSLSDKLQGLSDSELVNTIVNLTEGNADDLGEFIACPVIINTEPVYGIENYGSAMAPFYSTLAIWVGAIILVALIKLKVKNKKEIGPNVKPYEEYFGRGMIFILFSLIQSVIICVGDLVLLDIQCYHPVKFMLAGVLAAFVFSLFIYSLVAAWGDVGKAIAVILLVIQLGGSAGTFPIDVTPKFFQIVHPYLPYTFVINAMRECICGTYGNDYWFDLLKLCAYIPISLLIGTLFRYLFKNPMKFFNHKVEETGLF